MKRWLAPVRMKWHYLRGWMLGLPYRLPKPLAWADTAFENGRLEKSIALAIGFLRRKQRRDGAFRGFLLPPGCSDGWIPAHIAFVLEDVPAAREICRNDGGWGYNRIVGIDNDSTAQALMVLARHGYESPRFLIENLVCSRHADGGFPTYRGGDTGNSWQQPHTDISLLVAELLRRDGRFEKELAAINSWLQQQSSAGSMEAFWWEGDWYNRWAMQKAGWGETSIAADTVRALIADQLADGSWKGAAMLRLPSRQQPRNPARLYADPFRVFPTCHAIAQLYQFLQQQEAGIAQKQLPEVNTSRVEVVSSG